MPRLDIKDDTELRDVARLFFGDDIPPAYILRDNNMFTVEAFDMVFRFDYSDIAQLLPTERRAARLSKIALYDALSAHTGEKSPWGALTGVRPTKLFYEALKGGNSEAEATRLMQDVYRVSGERATILRKIVDAQHGKVLFPRDYINLYIHIPFCPTRCNYCSFVSVPLDKRKENSEQYVSLLCKEIDRTLVFLREKNMRILSVYIGGGTPTALDENKLCEVLDAIGDCDCEYTCEAGRPDSITDGKAQVMREHNVTRVCINPQTLNDETLRRIGRHHNSAQFFDAYNTVSKYGFDINCDLIAGLDGESEEDFAKSFDGVKALSPHNLTVHSLAKKNGSEIRYEKGENERTAAMTDYAFAHSDGYVPYYLYRQKRQSCNLENVGFSLPGKECINNITTMEETVGVMACGAGAISKFVGDGIISRFANIRDVKLYAERFDEKLDAKLEFFSQMCTSDKKA
ncbi:MAG: coproporphyrinogen dehydrogenase HemZ [Clostridiales bacterium]|nr:coproporphyrinogen dehydrogenase HemZ [Clostridiales bacterium]